LAPRTGTLRNACDACRTTLTCLAEVQYTTTAWRVNTLLNTSLRSPVDLKTASTYPPGKEEGRVRCFNTVKLAKGFGSGKESATYPRYCAVFGISNARIRDATRGRSSTADSGGSLQTGRRVRRLSRVVSITAHLSQPNLSRDFEGSPTRSGFQQMVAVPSCVVLFNWILIKIHNDGQSSDEYEHIHSMLFAAMKLTNCRRHM